jgi:hypothetical protein
MTQEQLEAKVRTFWPLDQHPNDCIELPKLTDDQIFSLLAWELWKDGMDWELGIADIAEGKTASYNTREKCMHILKTVFGY